MPTTAWLLDSDPAIRWQVLRDLADAEPALVASERSRVASTGLGAELLRCLGGLLLELTPQRLGALAEALRRDDLAAARMAVHALSSTAGTVGAEGLLGAAQRVEAAPSAPEARAAAAVLEDEWRRLEPPLSRWLAGPEGGAGSEGLKSLE